MRFNINSEPAPDPRRVSHLDGLTTPAKIDVNTFNFAGAKLSFALIRCDGEFKLEVCGKRGETEEKIVIPIGGGTPPTDSNWKVAGVKISGIYSGNFLSLDLSRHWRKTWVTLLNEGTRVGVRDGATGSNKYFC